MFKDFKNSRDSKQVRWTSGCSPFLYLSPNITVPFCLFSSKKSCICDQANKNTKATIFPTCWFPQVFSSLSPSFLKERGSLILSLTEKQRTSKEEDYNINSRIFVRTVDFLGLHIAKILPHHILLLFCPSPATSVLNSVS